ncbi:hypothetical protein K435DRAFT_652878 [Dendrothele bispora CBS 962.96]|uniref:EF-hand domain-containing protein n=1 Tax=Dendrothele bispora (strain CBS 962.96) TaxID=1314807 RepID=A0A4V4HHG5_DENBC|nr:hypothetical protein K435DRAFT_652878 [Dendrothele bispora CBS 962.96]
MIDGLNKIEGLASGPHLRVLDPELRVIWKEMGWKLSVHASKFVSTLHDFYIAQHHSSEMMDEILKSDSIANQQETLRRLMDEAKKRTADKWALEHVNIANLQSIVAVFDMDANEYVNVWEANSALAFKPEGWR